MSWRLTSHTNCRKPTSLPAAVQYGPFLFRTTDDAFVGYSGVVPAPIGEPGDIELLYGILPSFWGRGIATRMSRLVVD